MVNQNIILTHSYALIITNEGNLSAEKIAEVSDNFGNVRSSFLVGDLIFLGTERGGLVVINISNPLKPSFVSNYLIDGYISCIYANDNLVYLVIESKGFLIVDFNDLFNPILLSELSISTSIISDIVIQDDLAYVVSDYEFEIIDVSDLYNPYILYHYSEFNCFIIGLFLESNLLYLCGFPHLILLNVSDTTNVEIISSLELEESSAIDIIVKNKIVYLGIDNNGLSVINATDYINPVFLTRYNDTISSYHGFDIKNNYLYSANYYYSLDIFNIENVSNLQLINSHQTKTDNSDIYVVNNYAFLISIFSGLIIFDINDVYTPQIIGWFNCEGYTYDLFVKDDYLYLADGKSGLEIYDIQKLSNPYEVGECLNSFEKRLSTIFVSNDYAFLGGYSNFLSIANITNPLEPIEIITEFYSFQIVDIFVEENLAYLSRGISGFAILDISDFSNIQTIGYNNCAPAYVVSLEKKEDLLYISNYAQGVWIFDISNISNPIKVGEINTLGIAENICIKDNYLIVQESLFLIGFEIFDISTEIPTLISQFKTHVWGIDDGDYWANDIFVQENFVYISCKEDGIKIVDITNPANPNSYFNISNIGRVETLEIMNDYIFIACGYDGFKIYTTPHKQKYAIALYLIPVIPVMIAISIIVGIRRYRKS